MKKTLRRTAVVAALAPAIGLGLAVPASASYLYRETCYPRSNGLVYSWDLYSRAWVHEGPTPTYVGNYLTRWIRPHATNWTDYRGFLPDVRYVFKSFYFDGRHKRTHNKPLYHWQYVLGQSHEVTTKWRVKIPLNPDYDIKCTYRVV